MFQSVVIVGGYGTGRELMEYFLSLGPKSGLLAMLVTMGIWSSVCAITFEYARVFKGYDYRSFFKNLLGSKAWHLFELTYLGLVIVALAIIAAASGSMVQSLFNLPFNFGVLCMMCMICFVTLKGSKLIVILFSYWSILLYTTYITFFIACFSQFGNDIVTTFTNTDFNPGWLNKGVAYASYNLGFIPAVLFCLRDLKSRKEAICSGLFAGVFAIVPAVFFLIAVSGHYPSIISVEVPSTYILKNMDNKVLLIIYHVVLLGSLVETAVASIHAVNERIANHFKQRQGSEIKNYYRIVTAIILISVAFVVAQFGLATLIAKGYGTLTWLFLAFYILPLFTIGFYKLHKSSIRQGKEIIDSQLSK